MKKRLWSIINYRGTRGVIVRSRKGRKWTYYTVVFEDAELSSNDWDDNLIEYVELREDQL